MSRLEATGGNIIGMYNYSGTSNRVGASIASFRLTKDRMTLQLNPYNWQESWIVTTV
jgi:hypothetical protein